MMIKLTTFITIIMISIRCFAALPQGFVYLDEVDSTIQFDLKYAGKDNFLGREVNGYDSNKRVILTKEAALALKKAQEILYKDGFSIVVYDAYRPQMAVDDFVNWAKDQNDKKMKAIFYPRVDKNKLFELGYISQKSSHTRGSTVDLSIIEINKKLHLTKEISRKLKDGYKIVNSDDGTLDMGSSFDLFDKASHYKNDLISAEHKLHR